MRWRGWYWTCAARESCIWRWCCAPPHPLPQGCGEDKECRRPAAFCAAGVLAALLLGEVRPLAVLCQLLTAAGVWLLLPEKEGMLLTAAGEVSPEAAGTCGGLPGGV